MSEQQKEFPIGARVKTVQACTGITHDGKTHGAFPAGVPVVVEGYNDDGRARFRINGDTHTFDDPWRYLAIEKVVAKTEVSVSEQWTDEQIESAVFAIVPINVYDMISLMRRMREDLAASHDAELKAVQKQLYGTLQRVEELLEQKYEMTDRIGELVSQNRELQANEHS